MQYNPFSFGNPVRYDAFLGRKREMRKLVGRLVNGGQSTALIGEPRTGKTSLINYIAEPDTQKDLYSEHAGLFHFSYFDAQTLGDHFTQSDFWMHAFIVLKDAGMFEPGTPLAEAFKNCAESGYSTFMLERLFARMHTLSLRLILVIDEFDALLFHPVLNRGEFFGGLRSLASRCESLAVIIASRQSLTVLNEKTQELSRTGSPFFNIFEEVPIPPLNEAEIAKLLGRAGKRFNPEIRSYLQTLAGGHPYLLQVAAHALWEAYEDGERDPVKRWNMTGDTLYRQSRTVLDDTWRYWSPETKKVFTIVALDSMPAMIGQKRFDLSRLSDTLNDFGSELRSLESRGFIHREANPNVISGYAVNAEVMSWWLADQLILALRNGDDLGSWLRLNQWDGMFTTGERSQLVKAANGVGGFLKGGVETFIKAAAEGFGKSISGAA